MEKLKRGGECSLVVLLLAEQRRGWSLMIFCARATRALRRMRREWPGALLARRTRTVKLCSFDARSKGQPWPLPLGQVRKFGRPSYGLMARLGVPVGGRVRKSRAWEINQTPSLKDNEQVWREYVYRSTRAIEDQPGHTPLEKPGVSPGREREYEQAWKGHHARWLLVTLTKLSAALSGPGRRLGDL